VTNLLSCALDAYLLTYLLEFTVHAALNQLNILRSVISCVVFIFFRSLNTQKEVSEMQSVVRHAGRRLIPTIKPAFNHHATIVSGPPRYPLPFAVSMSRWPW